MKDDAISRQAATTIPVMPKEHRHYQTSNLDDAYEQGWNDLQECIEHLPPVQPTQEIIHCKDCKHYRAYAGRLDGYCYKAEWYNRYQNEDDFAVGERGEANGQE